MNIRENLTRARKAVKKFFTSQQSLDFMLVEAVKAGDVEKMKKAAAEGGSPSAVSRDWEKETPLLIAIAAKNVDMVRALLEVKADPNTKIGYHANTALLEAVRQNQTEIAQALVAAGADVNAANSNGGTPFLYAVAARNKPLIALFAEKGAKLDVQGSNGWSPLAYAVRNGDVETANMLLEKGARTDRCDDKGRTLLDIAAQYEQPATKRALLDHADRQIPRWQKLEDADEVAHISVMRDAGYKLTEVFNLRTNRVTTITHNFETGQDASVSRGLSDGDTAAVAEAKQKLETFKAPAPTAAPPAAPKVQTA